MGGNYDSWNKRFAGTLDYDAESGKFKGTIYTQDDTYKTYEDLFGNSDYTIATLLPAGYKDHGYLVINTKDPDAQYDDFIEASDEYTLATSKADGVAQFSYEKSYNYNDGFALSPENAILNFTVTGLAASTEVAVALTGNGYNITGTVTTDGSGNATFAAGIMAGSNLQPFSLNVAGNPITIVSSEKVVAEGKIYNITRAVPVPFSVSSTDKVFFSKGNLQATTTNLGSTWTWAFAAHQWDFIGNAAGNTSINGNGTVSANGTVDLFGWVGASTTWTGGAIYGISNSTATNNVNGYGNVGDEALESDWSEVANAANLGGHNDWRTLSRNEWNYILSDRETGATVNSTGNARYTQAIINTDGTGVKGLIIFPDGYTGGTPAGVTWGTINATSTFNTTCTSAGWTALETAGCIFLPTAGYREASSVTDADVGAGYWSSSSSSASYAFGIYFESDYMKIQSYYSRKYGYSVRLVRDAN